MEKGKDEEDDQNHSHGKEAGLDQRVNIPLLDQTIFQVRSRWKIRGAVKRMCQKDTIYGNVLRLSQLHLSSLKCVKIASKETIMGCSAPLTKPGMTLNSQL